MKIPMLLFEIQNLGFRFAASRYTMFFRSVFHCFFLDKILGVEEKKSIMGKF